MNSRKLTESDIIDVLLGNATRETARKVEEARRSSPEVAAIYARWEKIVPAMKEENLRASAVAENSSRKVMVRLAEETNSRQQPVGSGNSMWSESLRTLFAGPGWKQAFAVAAVAACAALAIVYSVREDHPGGEPMIGTGSLDTKGVDIPVLATTYVDFGHQGPEPIGTESQPFGSLTEGIEAASPGATIRIKGNSAVATTQETPRITKAIRLEAVGGEVRIGRLCESDDC